jgi:DNA repair exonuclease SbcCD ATPase subunit
MGKLEQIEQECKKLQQEFEAYAKKASEFENAIKGYVPIEFEIDGIIKDYKDSVQHSNGLTSIKPSVVKLLDTASIKPTKAALASAAKAVEDHLKEVTKNNGETAKKDPNVKKSLGKFTTDMNELIARIKKHDSVG